MTPQASSEFQSKRFDCSASDVLDGLLNRTGREDQICIKVFNVMQRL